MIIKVVVRRLPPQISLKEFLRELPEVPKYKYIRVSPPPAGLPSSKIILCLYCTLMTVVMTVTLILIDLSFFAFFSLFR